VFITGGDTNKVTRYGQYGFLQDMPPLKTARKYHACAGYYNDHNDFVFIFSQKSLTSRSFISQVLLVTGGQGSRSSSLLSSTELLEVDKSTEWRTTNKQMQIVTKLEIELGYDLVNNFRRLRVTFRPCIHSCLGQVYQHLG